jgi:hypothetical protein
MPSTDAASSTERHMAFAGFVPSPRAVPRGPLFVARMSPALRLSLFSLRFSFGSLSRMSKVTYSFGGFTIDTAARELKERG